MSERESKKSNSQAEKPDFILPADARPRDSYVKLPIVMQVSGKSKSAIYREIKLGRFPAPVKIGDRSSGWHWGTLIDHLAALRG